MDVNAITPILTAFSTILPQIGFQKIEQTGTAVESSTLDNKGIMINIGVLGPLKGAILIGMDLDSAKQFASKMMLGMPVTELDALAQSAISEMANMVCANSCTIFAASGITGLDISPPTLLLGPGGQVRLSVPNILSVTFLADDIQVNVYVGLF